jgi:hypothetical protein
MHNHRFLGRPPNVCLCALHFVFAILCLFPSFLGCLLKLCSECHNIVLLFALCACVCFVSLHFLLNIIVHFVFRFLSTNVVVLFKIVHWDPLGQIWGAGGGTWKRYGSA